MIDSLILKMSNFKLMQVPG